MKKIILMCLISMMLVLSLFNVSFTAMSFTNNGTDIINLIGSITLLIFTFAFSYYLYKINDENNILLYILPVFLSIVIVSCLLFSTNSYFKSTKMPNFKDSNLVVATEWAEKRGINFNIVYENSDIISDFNIIGQSLKEGSGLKEVKDITFYVSIGPDSNKIVMIPDMTGLTSNDVMDFVNKNYLSNVKLSFISSKIGKNILIEQSSYGEKKRNDEIVMVFSIGSDVPSTANIKDVQNMSLFEAEFNLASLGIKYKIEYEFSNEVIRGRAIKTNKSENEVINTKDDEVILYISKGKEIVVPDLLKMELKDVVSFVGLNRLKIAFDDKYDDKIEKGSLLEASVKKGDIIEEGTIISVVTSKGPLKMEGFTSLNEFKSWANKYGTRYSEVYENSDTVDEGNIIKCSFGIGEIIPNNEEIIVTVSKGPKVTVPSFIGLKKDEIINKCNELVLACGFGYGSFSDSTPLDTATSQSVSASTMVDRHTEISITLSKGKGVTIPNFVGMSRSDAQARCSNVGLSCSFVNGGYTSYNANVAYAQSRNSGVVVDKNTKITITLSLGIAKTSVLNLQGGWFYGGSPSATISTLKTNLGSLYPGVNFVYVTKVSNSGPSGGFHENSPTTTGMNVTQGRTYEIWIKQ